MQVELMVPVFVQIALTFVLLFRTAFARVSSIKNKEVTMAEVAVDPNAFPKAARQAANAYHNQLELPFLFYALAAFTLIFSQADYVMLVLAWVFVISRLWHAWIHTTHNNVLSRFRIFVIGVGALMIGWIYLAFKLLVA